MRRIDPTLVTMHRFGCIVIALHARRLLAVAVITPDDTEHVEDLRRTQRRVDKVPHKPFAVSWGMQ